MEDIDIEESLRRSSEKTIEQQLLHEFGHALVGVRDGFALASVVLYGNLENDYSETQFRGSAATTFPETAAYLDAGTEGEKLLRLSVAGAAAEVLGSRISSATDALDKLEQSGLSRFECDRNIIVKVLGTFERSGVERAIRSVMGILEPEIERLKSAARTAAVGVVRGDASLVVKIGGRGLEVSIPLSMVPSPAKP